MILIEMVGWFLALDEVSAEEALPRSQRFQGKVVVTINILLLWFPENIYERSKAIPEGYTGLGQFIATLSFNIFIY